MLLAGDGRHVWLGRNSDPTEQEIADAGAALDKQRLTGWLAVCRGDYWGEGEPELLLVRRVTEWNDADERTTGELWRQARRERLASFSDSGRGK